MRHMWRSFLRYLCRLLIVMSHKEVIAVLENSIEHEYFQLEVAYKQFLHLLLKNKKADDPTLKVLLYSGYSRVIQHLWELMKAQVCYKVSKTQSEKENVVEEFIVRALESSAEQYDDETTHPQSKAINLTKYESFAKDLRIHRNRVSGHVLSEKFSAYPLSDFWSKYHAYVVRLISSLEQEWSTSISSLASVPEVDSFSKMLTFGQDKWGSNS